MNLLGSIGNIFSPISSIVDGVFSALNLPPALGNAAKVAAGVITANPVLALEGGIGLAGNALEEGAKTEYRPSGSGNAAGARPPPGKGWAPSGPSQAPRMQVPSQGPFDGNILGMLAQGLGQMGIPLLGSGAQLLGQVVGALANPGVQEGLQQAVGYDVNVNSGGVEVSSERAPVKYTPGSPLDPNIVKYRNALEVLGANFQCFDSAAGRADGLVTKTGLSAITSNPNASKELKDAAGFLLQHPEYFNRLESAGAAFGMLDGKISLGDVGRELFGVNQQIRQFGVPFKEGTSSGSSSGSSTKAPSQPKSGDSDSISKILNNSHLSVEEKVRLVLEEVLKDIDDDVEKTMSELNKAQDGKSGTGNASNTDALTRKLQTLMERRKQMVELVSNMGRTFSDMAMASIRNMRN